MNFSATGPDGDTLACGAGSGATAKALRTTQAHAGASDIQIYNPGAYDAFVKCGGADVVATANSLVVPAGSVAVYSMANASHIAGISPGGAVTLQYWLSQGT